ncbi:MAG: MFS family permease [Lysobacterales bacterium]|jgi:MFS family permease
MIRAITPVAALLIGTAILLTGQGLQGVLLPVRANLEGFSTFGIGAIGAFYFLGFTWGCWKGSALIRRVGHVRVFAAMTALASASPLVHGLWVSLWSWGVLRFVSGFCFAVLYIVIESWLNEQSSDENRGTVFSAYILINMTVLAVGQQMLLLYDPINLQLFAIASVLVSLAAVPVALSTSATPKQIEDSRLDFKFAFNNSPAGMLGCLATGMANGAFWSLGPVFIAALTKDVALAAWFLTAGVLGGAAGQYPLGLLSDRIDRRYVLLGIAIGSAILCAIIWSLAEKVSINFVLALGFAWGALSFPSYSISVAHANDHANPDSYVLISSALLLMYGIGAIVGPIVASGFMIVAGASGLYFYTALVHLLLACYILFASLRRKSAEPGNSVEFSDALASTITTSHVYDKEGFDYSDRK